MSFNLKKTFQELAGDTRYIEDVKEVYVNKLFSEDYRKFFTIVTDVKARKQVAGANGIEGISRKATADCKGVCITPEITAYTQTWDPREIYICTSWCYDKFNDKFTQWGLANGYQKRDLSQAKFFTWLKEFISDAILNDLHRIALFGDSNIKSQSILGDNSNAEHFDMIDKGLIPTLLYFKTRDDFKNHFVDISKNTFKSGESQSELKSGYAVDLYENLMKGPFKNRFKGDLLMTSQSLFDNYESYFKEAYKIQSSKEEIQKGIKNLSVNGQLIQPDMNYDIWSAKYFTKSTGAQYLPHFALYTKKEHMQIGLDSESGIRDISLEYVGGADESFYLKAAYMMDFKYLNPYEMRVAV